MRNHYWMQECPKHGVQKHIGAAGGQCYRCLREAEEAAEKKETAEETDQ